MLRPVCFKCEVWVSSRICHEWNIAAWISKRKNMVPESLKFVMLNPSTMLHINMMGGLCSLLAAMLFTERQQWKRNFIVWNVIFYGTISCCYIMSRAPNSTCQIGKYLLELFLQLHTVYPKKYAHGFCFAVLCCDYTLTDFPIHHQAYFTGTVAI